MGPQGSEFVLLYDLDGVPHEHVLQGDRIVIGRAKDCNLCLAFNSEVSRLHATLTATPEGWVVEDMSSRLGTYVNGQRINEPCRLGDKDVLGVGQVSLTLREKKYGTETVSVDSLGPEAKGEIMAAAREARSSGSTGPVDSPATPPVGSAAQAQTPVHAPPVNFYELIGVDDFERDLGRIQQAAKNRMSQLRSGSGDGSPEHLQSQVDTIASGLAAVSNPEKRRAYDLELAERLGIEVEVRGGRVVPVGQEGAGQLFVGLAVLGVIVLALWFGLPYLRAALAPLLEGGP